MSKGWVYVATNQSMPGIVKIGRSTNHPEQRMSELQTTGVPTPFECFYCVLVTNHEELELSLHRIFSNFRVTSNREFFKISPEQVSKEIRQLAQPLYEEGNTTTTVDAAKDNARLTKVTHEETLQAKRLERSEQFELIKSAIEKDILFFFEREQDFLHYASRIAKVRQSRGKTLGFGFPGLQDAHTEIHDKKTPSGKTCLTQSDGAGNVYSGERSLFRRLDELELIGIERYSNGTAVMGGWLVPGWLQSGRLDHGPSIHLFRNGSMKLLHFARNQKLRELTHWPSGKTRIQNFEGDSLNEPYVLGDYKLEPWFGKFLDKVYEKVSF